MEKQGFWRTSSNWGFLVGIALFVVNMISWLLKLEVNAPWVNELLLFIVLVCAIWYTGKRNAARAGGAGYSYGRAVGFVLAMMMFAGVVAGVGRFLLYNFIAVAYYDPLIEQSMDNVILGLSSNNDMMDFLIDNRQIYINMVKNPFVMILSSVIELVFKGGFVGLVLCAFLKKDPDIFGGQSPQDVQQPDEQQDE